jgi:hypothetical protein
MTAYTTLPDDTSSSKGSGHSAAGFPSHVVFEGVFDATKRTLAQNDTLAVIDIPANTLIQGVQWEVEVAEGAARNFAVGDGSDTDGFITTTSANSLASGVSTLAGTVAGGSGDPASDPLVVTGYSAGKYYSAADTLDVLAVTSGGLTTTKIRLKAWGICFG